jgi:prolipoprotein diacylglyceryltransferase
VDATPAATLGADPRRRGRAGHLGAFGISRHTSFLYELLWNIAIALLVVWADRRFRLGHGHAFAFYLAGYTAGRFWVEPLRTDDATHVLGLRINTIVSAVVFLGAIAYLVLARERGPREDLSAINVGGKPQQDAEISTPVES